MLKYLVGKKWDFGSLFIENVEFGWQKNEGVVRKKGIVAQLFKEQKNRMNHYCFLACI